ncbi:MAG: SDR family oxidoreductase [Thalassovita sp.]
MTEPRRFASYPSLRGASVFITGGATGIGAAMVRGFCRQGARVGFVDLATEPGEALAADTGAAFICADVTDIAALQAAIADFGTVDVLVNNVANDARHDWREVTPQDWDQSFAVNLRPAFFAIQAVAPQMIERKSGSIINFGSISWKARLPTAPSYTTAKSAVHGLTRSFVETLGPHHVRINTLMPGWVLTERQRREHFDAAGQAFLTNNQPLAGEIAPEDAAAMALFLAAEDSAMCTGQEFTLDGGWT